MTGICDKSQKLRNVINFQVNILNTNPEVMLDVALTVSSGRRGIYSSSSGLCIAYLSGLGAAVGGKALWAEMRQAKADPVAASRRINEHDLDVVSSQLQASKGGPVDLLLTAQWPAGIERWTRPIEAGEKKEKKDSLRFGSALVSRLAKGCLLYTSPSPRDLSTSRMPSSA